MKANQKFSSILNGSPVYRPGNKIKWVLQLTSFLQTIRCSKKPVWLRIIVKCWQMLFQEFGFRRAFNEIVSKCLFVDRNAHKIQKQCLSTLELTNMVYPTEIVSQTNSKLWGMYHFNRCVVSRTRNHFRRKFFLNIERREKEKIAPIYCNEFYQFLVFRAVERTLKDSSSCFSYSLASSYFVCSFINGILEPIINE